MAMSAGGSPSRGAQINVTPMIDILLVLLIIFMVVTAHEAGLPALAPEPGGDSAAPAEDRGVVLTVHADDTVSVNQETVAIAALGERLRRVFGGRRDPVIFVSGDEGIEFAAVARAIDVARGAGLTRVALIRRLDAR